MAEQSDRREEQEPRGEVSILHLIYRKASIIKLDLSDYAHHELCPVLMRLKKGKATHRIMLLVLIMIFLPSCGGAPQGAPPESREEAKGAKMAIEVRSSAFAEGEAIQSRYTCDGLDVSPPLSWASVPDGTRSLALIADDPDAPRGTFVHWVIYNLPPYTRRLPEGVPNQLTLPSGAVQGVNGAGSVGYMGPCPPSGTHRYFFKVYALDTELDFGGRARKEDLMRAMEGHVLTEGQLMGTYQRR